MWEFYLTACEMTFRKQGMMNFQIHLTRRQGVVPMIRDSIAHEEARLRGLEGDTRPKLKLAGESALVPKGRNWRNPVRCR